MICQDDVFHCADCRVHAYVSLATKQQSQRTINWHHSENLISELTSMNRFPHKLLSVHCFARRYSRVHAASMQITRRLKLDSIFYEYFCETNTSNPFFHSLERQRWMTDEAHSTQRGTLRWSRQKCNPQMGVICRCSWINKMHAKLNEK